MSLFNSLVDDELTEAIRPAGVWMELRTDGSGRGTIDDPFDGSHPSSFDQVMAGVSRGATVYIGPGTFETRGGYGAGAIEQAWVPKSGQRVVGAGMYATTLRLQLSAIVENASYAVVGAPNHQPLDGFEISDLTIDCNLAGQPIPEGKEFARIACTALRLPGNHIRIRRVRVINFGTNTPVEDGPVLSKECFPIFVTVTNKPGAKETFDCIIEDCIVEQPTREETSTLSFAA